MPPPFAAARQTHAEIRQDHHPVVILMEKGLNSAERVRAWLEGEFPPAGAT